MGVVIAEVLPLAIGVALSPLPIAAMIVILFTPRARTNAPAFLLAWVVGLLVVGAVVFVIPGLETRAGDPTPLSGAIRCVVGLLLVGMAWRQWRSRPGPAEPLKVPGWMRRIDAFGVGRSAGLGFLCSSVHPKNLLLTAAAAATIDESRLAPLEQFGALLGFAALASITVAVPPIGVLIAGRRAEETLARARDWLVANAGLVAAALLLVFGILLVGRGIQILGGTS